MDGRDVEYRPFEHAGEEGGGKRGRGAEAKIYERMHKETKDVRSMRDARGVRESRDLDPGQ